MADQVYILENKLTPQHVTLIDYAVRGMMLANSMELHADQGGTYGGFSKALTSLLTEVYGETIGALIYNRYNFDHYSGAEFIEWFNAIIAEDKISVSAYMESTAITVREVF